MMETHPLAAELKHSLASLSIGVASLLTRVEESLSDSEDLLLAALQQVREARTADSSQASSLDERTVRSKLLSLQRERESHQISLRDLSNCCLHEFHLLLSSYFKDDLLEEDQEQMLKRRALPLIRKRILGKAEEQRSETRRDIEMEGVEWLPRASQNAPESSTTSQKCFSNVSPTRDDPEGVSLEATLERASKVVNAFSSEGSELKHRLQKIRVKMSHDVSDNRCAQKVKEARSSSSDTRNKCQVTSNGDAQEGMSPTLSSGIESPLSPLQRVKLTRAGPLCHEKSISPTLSDTSTVQMQRETPTSEASQRETHFSSNSKEQDEGTFPSSNDRARRSSTSPCTDLPGSGMWTYEDVYASLTPLNVKQLNRIGSEDEPLVGDAVRRSLDFGSQPLSSFDDENVAERAAKHKEQQKGHNKEWQQTRALDMVKRTEDEIRQEVSVMEWDISFEDICQMTVDSVAIAKLLGCSVEDKRSLSDETNDRPYSSEGLTLENCDPEKQQSGGLPTTSSPGGVMLSQTVKHNEAGPSIKSNYIETANTKQSSMYETVSRPSDRCSDNVLPQKASAGFRTKEKGKKPQVTFVTQNLDEESKARSAAATIDENKSTKHNRKEEPKHAGIAAPIPSVNASAVEPNIDHGARHQCPTKRKSVVRSLNGDFAAVSPRSETSMKETSVSMKIDTFSGEESLLVAAELEKPRTTEQSTLHVSPILPSVSDKSQTSSNTAGAELSEERHKSQTSSDTAAGAKLSEERSKGKDSRLGGKGSRRSPLRANGVRTNVLPSFSPSPIKPPRRQRTVETVTSSPPPEFMDSFKAMGYRKQRPLQLAE